VKQRYLLMATCLWWCFVWSVESTHVEKKTNPPTIFLEDGMSRHRTPLQALGQRK
jgi:hypothetical protein